jgi:GT2 family glycosyltransferase
VRANFKFKIFPMDLSVVITHHKEVGLLRKCLNALQEELEGIDFEIIIAISECQKEVLEELKNDFFGVEFLPFEKNLYFVRLANRGLERAKGEYVLLLNDDVVVSNGSVKSLLDFLKNNLQVGLVGPKVLYPNGESQQSYFRFYTPSVILCRRSFLGKLKVCRKINSRFLYKDKGGFLKIMEVDWLMNGAGIMAKREGIEKVGLLDERFKHYFSDVDWARRFWQNGLKVIYYPEAVFYHHHKKSSRGGVMSLFFNKMARMHLADGIKYFWKWKKYNANPRMSANVANRE